MVRRVDFHCNRSRILPTNHLTVVNSLPAATKNQSISEACATPVSPQPGQDRAGLEDLGVGEDRGSDQLHPVHPGRSEEHP